MKNFKIFSLLFLFSTMMMVNQSCEKAEALLDPCASISCNNGGTCNDGVCENCDTGYEGELCATLSRDKMIGNYSLAFDCNGFTSNATASSEPSDDLKFIINYGPTQYVLTMTGETTFNMPSQQVCSICNTIEGNGSIDTTTGIITVNTVDPMLGNCVETFTPQ